MNGLDAAAADPHWEEEEACWQVSLVRASREVAELVVPGRGARWPPAAGTHGDGGELGGQGQTAVIKAAVHGIGWWSSVHGVDGEVDGGWRCVASKEGRGWWSMRRGRGAHVEVGGGGSPAAAVSR